MKPVSRRDFLKGATLGSLSLNAVGFPKNSLGETDFDFVVAGAGHNSLITAAYLVKAGFSVIGYDYSPSLTSFGRSLGMDLRHSSI